jgi:UDP-N-acetylglucosamine 4,6-dehydratase/5-epimerase
MLCGTRYGKCHGFKRIGYTSFCRPDKKGKPITITDPKMTRFMMTLDDAVNLVIFAYDNGHPGRYLRSEITGSNGGSSGHALMGLYNTMLDIKIIGTRHGEKFMNLLSTGKRWPKPLTLEGITVFLLIYGI